MANKQIKDYRLNDMFYKVTGTSKIKKVRLESMSKRSLTFSNQDTIRIGEDDLTRFKITGSYGTYYTEPHLALRHREINIQKEIADCKITINHRLDMIERYSNMLVESLKFE